MRAVHCARAVSSPGGTAPLAAEQSSGGPFSRRRRVRYNPAMAGIFINYRRDDAPGVAGRLFDHLAARFSKDDLFMDVDAMKPGMDFSKQLDTQVSQCRVLLAVIGPHWLDAKDKTGARRLDSDKDYVRIELASALKRDIAVIPVLVDGATMPPEESLSEDLKPLAYRHALELRHTPFQRRRRCHRACAGSRRAAAAHALAVDRCRHRCRPRDRRRRRDVAEVEDEASGGAAGRANAGRRRRDARARESAGCTKTRAATGAGCASNASHAGAIAHAAARSKRNRTSGFAARHKTRRDHAQRRLSRLALSHRRKCRPVGLPGRVPGRNAMCGVDLHGAETERHDGALLAQGGDPATVHRWVLHVGCRSACPIRSCACRRRFPSGVTGALAGVELEGGSYRYFPDATIEGCQAACRADNQCMAWDYVRPGIFATDARCFLKNKMAMEVQSPCCVAGYERQIGASPTAPATPAPAAASKPVMPNTDLRGSSYRNFELSSADATLCQNTCKAESQCLAWTYVHPGVQGANARCWLKNLIPPPSANNCCTSGIERAAAQ